jgi:pilus assembly protein FimV
MSEPEEPPPALKNEPGDSMADALTGYVESLSSDVGEMEGGLPDDLAILPVEAVQEEQAPAQSPAQSPTRTDDEFVDLNEWLLEDEAPRNPRMTADEEDKPAGEVQTDFSEMLETFKAGVAANVDESDSDSHYDLGVAYMEMGLFDEAIAQFQKAMRGDASPERRVRAYESLGQSFIEKNQYEVAISSLSGALKESGLNDTKLVGVLYLLGYASEKLGQWQDAERYYRRVFAVDIHFRDVGERLKRAEQMA